MELVNSLPFPVTTACFVESLARPLRVEMTSSTFSVQPASGPSNPRIFVFSEPLVISVVPAGSGAAVVEFSELREDRTSVKAELAFPVVAPVAAEEAFAHLDVDGSRSSCGVCHTREVVDRTVGSATAYRSRAFRPEDRTIVPVASLAEASCDPATEPERCAVLAALFDHGTVREEHFLDALPTIFETPD